MNAAAVRSEHDVALAEQLLAEPEVQQLKGQLDERGGRGTRRSLLASALRLTPEVAPELHATVQACRARLDVTTEVELFVFASPAYNAACTQPEGERVFVLLASSLLEAFAPDELAYVVGHELGHHVYGHHEVPAQVLLQHGKGLRPELVLRAFAWQRHAEISADRAGLLCCGGLDGAARSLFKLSSGLRNAPGPENIEAFLDQASELTAESDALQAGVDRVFTGDWLSTHPFSPLRLLAARVFASSEAMVAGGTPMAVVEREVLDLMGVMEPGYLQEDSPEAESMRRVLFAAGLVVASSYEGVSSEERDTLESLLGPGSVPRELAIERVREVLPRRLDTVREGATPSRRAQLLRDLVLVARADGHVHDVEVAALCAVATRLGLGERLVHEALGSPVELD